MCRIVSSFALMIICLATLSCRVVDKEPAGEYTLETLRPMSPDHHPCTSVYRNEKLVWPTIFPGFFHPNGATNFTRDDIMLFVGGVPYEEDASHGDSIYLQFLPFVTWDLLFC